MMCEPSMNPSELIDKYISDLADWRGQMLVNLRKIIRDADPEMIEERKWRKPSLKLWRSSLRWE